MFGSGFDGVNFNFNQSPFFNRVPGRALSAVKRHAEQRQKGHRWVVQEYTSHHAVRKADVAKAIGLDRKVRRTTGVKGRGRYKTWTPQMMLRSALLVRMNGVGMRSA